MVIIYRIRYMNKRKFLYEIFRSMYATTKKKTLLVESIRLCLSQRKHSHCNLLANVYDKRMTLSTIFLTFNMKNE